MKFDDKRFEAVELNSLGPSACSPDIPAERSFRGIIIAVPRQIFLYTNPISPLTVPVCGFLRQEALKMPDGGVEAMKLMVMNRETGAQYGGYPVFSDMAEPPPPDENAIRKEALKGIVVGIYFNFDLMEMTRLPRQEAAYDAWLELGAKGSENYLQSNQVSFQLIHRDAD